MISLIHKYEYLDLLLSTTKRMSELKAILSPVCVTPSFNTIRCDMCLLGVNIQLLLLGFMHYTWKPWSKYSLTAHKEQYQN